MPNVGLSETAQRLRHSLLSGQDGHHSSSDTSADDEAYESPLESPAIGSTSMQPLLDVPSESSSTSSDEEDDMHPIGSRESRRVRQARVNLFLCLECVWEISSMGNGAAVGHQAGMGLSSIRRGPGDRTSTPWTRPPWSRLAKYAAALFGDLQDRRAMEVKEISACLAILTCLCRQHIFPATMKDSLTRNKLVKSEAKAIPIVVKYIRRIMAVIPTSDNGYDNDRCRILFETTPTILLRLASFALSSESRRGTYFDLSSLPLEQPQDELDKVDGDLLLLFGIQTVDVYRINISGNDLRHLPPIITSLHNLETIDARHNARLSYLPYKVSQLVRLRTIKTRRTASVANSTNEQLHRPTVPESHQITGPPTLMTLATGIVLRQSSVEMENALVHLPANLRGSVRSSYICEVCDMVFMPTGQGYLADAQRVRWQIGDKRIQVKLLRAEDGKSVWLQGRICVGCLAQYRT